MKSIFNGKYDYPDQIYSWINYDKFNDDKKNLVYIYGIFGEELPEGYKNRIYYNVEEPNGLYHSGKFLQERDLNGRILSYDWTVIYQNEPYSTEWLINVMGYKQYAMTYHFPLFDFKYLPVEWPEKIYDVVYQGSIYGPFFSSYIDVMTQFKHAWTTQQTSYDPRKTHMNLPFLEKVKLLCQSKMTVIDNRIFEPSPGSFLHNISGLPRWKENEAFSRVQDGFMPQFKIKALEHMLTRTLCIVKKSDWDIMEKMGFTEGEHFIYFEEDYELYSVMQECLNNWDACQPIVENAYQKVRNEDSAEAFYNRYLKPYDI